MVNYCVGCARCPTSASWRRRENETESPSVPTPEVETSQAERTGNETGTGKRRGGNTREVPTVIAGTGAETDTGIEPEIEWQRPRGKYVEKFIVTAQLCKWRRFMWTKIKSCQCAHYDPWASHQTGRLWFIHTARHRNREQYRYQYNIFIIQSKFTSVSVSVSKHNSRQTIFIGLSPGIWQWEANVQQ